MSVTLSKIISDLRFHFHRKNLLIFLLIAIVLGMTSCRTSQKLTDSGRSHSFETSTERKYGEVVTEAHSWIGTPYKYASQEKGVGTDCSGMVMIVYETTTGEKLPRNSAKQAEFCEEINIEDVKEGDLVFFATGKDPTIVSHVGIMIDKEKFIHASSSKGVVISSLNNSYYQSRLIMFGRVPRRKNKTNR